MAIVFLVCTAVGTTVLILQFLLSLVGLGHDFGGGDHDFCGDSHVELSHGALAAEHDAQNSLQPSAPESHGAASLFRVLSLRTIVAALAFFGLAGLAAQAADFSDFTALAIASAAGIGAMYAVYATLRGMRGLQSEGTARIYQAVGELGTVYLNIPARQQGAGKIQINVQNRTMEYRATTSGDAIPTGAAVVVVQVLGTDLVQVEAAAVGQPVAHPSS